jgi:hypothetical protein
MKPDLVASVEVALTFNGLDKFKSRPCYSLFVMLASQSKHRIESRLCNVNARKSDILVRKIVMKYYFKKDSE